MLFTPAEYGLFCLGSLALVISPGPDFFYVATRGLAGNRAAGVISALGIATGLVVHTTLAASGLTLLLFTSSWLFNLVKWCGALYLFWLGWNLLRARETVLTPYPNEDIPLSRIYRQGVLTNIFNPKAALTFAAFLPPFVHPERGASTLQIAVLGATLCLLALCWFCFVGLSAGHLGSSLRSHPRVAQMLNKFSGIVLIALGVRLAFAHRP